MLVHAPVHEIVPLSSEVRWYSVSPEGAWSPFPRPEMSTVETSPLEPEPLPLDPPPAGATVVELLLLHAASTAAAANASTAIFRMPLIIQASPGSGRL